MKLRHAVITVVNRDDLADSGADHYKQCIQAVAESSPQVTLELLCSDLAGDHEALAHLLEQSPLSVFAHNVECVPRLDPIVRDARASFAQSVSILKEAKRLRPDIITKSSLMVGVGETDEEIDDALGILKEAGVDHGPSDSTLHRPRTTSLSTGSLSQNAMTSGLRRPCNSVLLAWPADRLFAPHTKPDSWFARRRTPTTTKPCSEPMFGLHRPIHPHRHHLRRTSPEVNQ